MNASNTTYPTDSYIPPYLKELIPELGSLSSLQEKETVLDRYLVRKRLELEELAEENIVSFEEDLKSNQLLRIYVSNVAGDQPWQNPETESPNWTLRVEGRLLDSQYKADDPARPKFSSYLSSIALDFEQAQENDHYAQDPLDVVEWHENPHGPPVEFDGLDVKRAGSRNVNCRITIQPKSQTATVLQYSEPLSNITFNKNGALQDALYLVYTYITSNGYFDSNGNVLLSSDLLKNLVHYNKNKENKTTHSSGIRNNSVSFQTNGVASNTPATETENKPATEQAPSSAQQNAAEPVDVVMEDTTTSVSEHSEDANNDQPQQQHEHGSQQEIESITLNELNTLITKDHVKPLPPLVINYTIRCDKASTYGETCFDVVVKNHQNSAKGDTQKNKYQQLLQEYMDATSSINNDIQKSDTKISELMVELNNTYHRHQFYAQLSKDPVTFLNKYIESSSNMMKVLSGDEGFQEDEVRNSDFYKKNADILFEDIAVMYANGRI
ncbi:hypothetical protein ACO0RG_003063 [Hanseniaspora osmophila]